MRDLHYVDREPTGSWSPSPSELLHYAQSALCRLGARLAVLRVGQVDPGVESTKSIVTLPKPPSARIFEPLKSSAPPLSHSSL